jgi:hypothetical protein
MMVNQLYKLVSLCGIVIVSVLVLTISSFDSVYSQNLTNPVNDTIKGSITSNTNNGNSSDPAWILGGVYKITNLTNSPSFNATFYMVKINGTAEHTHSIYDFKLLGKPVLDNNNNSTLLNGTSTLTMREGPVSNVPTKINIMGDSAISIILDGSMTEKHFGSNPIFGTQHLICVEKPTSCQ